MRYEAEIKELLVKNAIHLIAEGGFEKATTKNLTLSGGHLPDLKMNEVYIYRLFGSKESIYTTAFLQLDDELYYAFKRAVQEIGGFDGNTREKLGMLFQMAWRFILKDEDRCRCYVRYYYSVYFMGESLRIHQEHFNRIAREMISLFKEEADVIAILHSVFTTLLNFAIRVYNRELLDTLETREHIFNVLYCMMMTYFKPSCQDSQLLAAGL